MSKKLKILITLIAIIVGGALLHRFYGIFTPYNYLSAKKDIAIGNIKILRYGNGLLPVKTQKVELITAPQFGFSYKVVSGCLVSKPMINGIEIYNSVMTGYLNEKLGAKWKTKFDFLVDSLFREERVDTIRKTALAISSVRSLSFYLDSISSGKRKLFVWVFAQNKKKPNVRIGEILPDSSIRVFDYYRIDPYSLEVVKMQY